MLYTRNGVSYGFQVRAVNIVGAADASNEAVALSFTAPDRNQAPVFIEGGSTVRHVAENTRIGSHVGSRVQAVDGDGDTLTYSLTGTDADRFVIDTSAGQLRTNSELDYETETIYKVTVSVSDGTSSNHINVTIEVTDTLEQPSIPNPPRVRALAGSLNSLVISWDEPANTGPAIDGYDVQYRQDGAIAWIDWPHTSTARTTVITDLHTGTIYQARIQARSVEGVSGWSNPRRGATLATIQSNNPPTGHPIITGIPQAGRTLTVDTTTIADLDGLNNATYNYQWLTNNTPIPEATTAVYTLTNNDVGRSIKVQVTYIDDAGNPEQLTSDATPSVTAADPDPELAWGQITNLKAEPGHGNGLILLTWTDPIHNQASITHYDLRWCHTNNCDPTTIPWQRISEHQTNLHNNTVHYYTHDLIPGDYYHFQIRAIDATGTPAQPSNQTGTTAHHGQIPPGAITNLTAETNNNHITLHWTQPPNEGQPIDQYYYRYCQGTNCKLAPQKWYRIWTPPTPTMTHTITNLTNNTTYRFQIHARNGSLSPNSNPTQATTQNTNNPKTPHRQQ